MLEAGDGVGGAWHWNTYPGIGVDIPSFSYQFSFEQRSDWSRVYAPGEELKAYAEHCVDAYGLALADPAEHEGHRCGVRRGEPLLAPADRRRGHRHRTVHGRRDRRLHPAQAARHPGARLLRRHGDAHGALGPRRGSARPQGGDRRHRRFRRPGHPLDRPRSREADRAAAHPDLVPAQARRADRPRPASAARPGSRRAGRGARPEPGLRRAQLPAAGPFPRGAASRQGGRTRRAPAPAPGARPGGAGEADAPLRARLQAAQLLERVPAGLQPSQRPPRDEPDRGDRARRGAHRRPPSTRPTC